MKMILIAESGSTKTDWCLTEGMEVRKEVSTTGLNPYINSAESIRDSIANQVKPVIESSGLPEKIFFYGSGCTTEEMKQVIAEALKFSFPSPAISVYSDMIAAARSLCGDSPGIVAILGTGSNSCAWENGKIIEQVPSLGYVLGDEGSGVDLGRRLLQAFLYGELEPSLHRKFELEYRCSVSSILDSVYKKPQPNRFIASFVPFIRNNMNDELRRLVEDAFTSFIRKHIMKYKILSSGSNVNFTGSVAFAFRDILKEVCGRYQLKVGNILQSPLQGLITYHAKDNL